MYKEKLIELLKSDEQVKTAMEKLQFGCKFIFDGIEFIYSGDKNADESILEGIESGDTKIIGLPLQERFIRMYCENKGIKLVIQANGVVEIIRGQGYYNETFEIIANLDNKEDLDNQSEEVFEKIFLALNEITIGNTK